MRVLDVLIELSLWNDDEAAAGCGKFMLHHSLDLAATLNGILGKNQPSATAGEAHGAETTRITLVPQPLWPKETWRLIPCCATMETRIEIAKDSLS